METSNIIGINDGLGDFTYIYTPFNSNTYVDYSFGMDFDNDMDIDLVGINNMGEGVYLKNDGSGNFTVFNHIGQFPRTIQKQNHQYIYLNTGDLNGDGFEDIITYHTVLMNDAKFDYYMNDGTSNFYLVDDNYIAPVAFGDSDFGDYDNDGDLDLILIGGNNGSASQIYSNNGDGGFVPVNASDIFTDISRGSCSFIDLNNDTFLDVLTTGDYNTNDEITNTYLNNQSGGFTYGNFTFPHMMYSETLVLDFDNDGDSDVLFAGENGGTHYCNLYKNIGAAQFQLFNNPFTPISYPQLSAGDADGDGDIDILTSGETVNDGNISKLYMNDGQGNFTHLDWGYTPDPNLETKSIFFDCNGDGNLDIFSTSYDNNNVENHIYLNNGLGMFTPLSTPAFNTPISGTPQSEDFNLDGFDDIIIYDESWSTPISIYLNDKNNGFINQNLPFSPIIGGTVSTGDLNNDGRPDIFYSGNFKNDMVAQVFLNTTDVSSIDELSHNKIDFNVFPNPTKNNVSISVNQNFNSAFVKIFNLLGEMVYYQDLTERTSIVNCKDLNGGIYLIQLNVDGVAGSKKLVIEE